MGKIIFFGTLAVLFLVACFIGVIALYLALKNWAWENMDIELPPKSKPQESYWNFFEDNSIITSHAFVCHSCNYKSDKKYWHCPCCGKFMENHEE